MTDKPGFKFTEAQAAKLVKPLQRSIELMSKTVAYADKNCDRKAALPYKKWLAEIMFDLGWVVLEQGFYKQYPQLRPKDSALRQSKNTPKGKKRNMANNLFEADAVKHRRPSGSLRAPRRSTGRYAFTRRESWKKKW